MRLVFRGLLAVLFGAIVTIGSGGCGKNDTTPNPDLKVPEIPPGGAGSKDAAMKTPTGKK